MTAWVVSASRQQSPELLAAGPGSLSVKQDCFAVGRISDAIWALD